MPYRAGRLRAPTSPEGELMFQLRIQADMSQTQLQDRTGVHFTTWSKIESGGRCRPTVDHIELFAKALDLPDTVWDELLRLRREPYKDFDKRKPYRSAARIVIEMRDLTILATNPMPPRPNEPDIPKPKNSAS